jgi:glycerol-3-phosphate dehydrogenase
LRELSSEGSNDKKAMQRDLLNLSRTEYDVLVIGGGAAGAAAARESALRGYRTALIERHDFGGGTSAHCFKVVHGGIRYVQHLDVPRLRASCRERSVLLKLAPHLVKPLPFVIPTYGSAQNSKWFLGAGMLLYDALTADRNAGQPDRKRQVRWTKFLSRDDVLTMFPDVRRERLTGAAVFEDGQMHNPPRLVLAFVSAAQRLGADVANYVEAERLLTRDQRVYGVRARDALTGEQFDIRARVIVNATGPWAEGLVRDVSATAALNPGTYSRDACFVISRPPQANAALALQGATRDADAVFARGGRHLFLVPWRGKTLVGVWHSVVRRDPDKLRLTREELQSYIREVNDSYPGFDLQESEVQRTDFGLVPFGDAANQRTSQLSFGKQSRVIDHRSADNLPGLITLISVRYTVARIDAVRAIDRAGAQLGSPRDGSGSSRDPLAGGDIDSIDALHADLQYMRPFWLPVTATESLAANYGSETRQLLASAEKEPGLRRCVGGSTTTLAEVAWAIEKEMALTLSDVVFRRTGLGTAGDPGVPALTETASFMQQALGWSHKRTGEELHAVERELGRFLAVTEPLRRSA